MSSIIRRAGSKLGRLIARVADPVAATGRAQIYAKDVTGVTQLFAMSGDGTVTQVSSPAAPATPQIYPRYPIPTWVNTTVSAKVLTNTEAYGNYIGKAGQALSNVSTRVQVLTAGVGLTFAEVAVATGSPVFGAGTSLNVIGWLDIAGLINSLGAKALSIPLSTPLAATDDMWLIFAASAGSVSPALWCSQVGDLTQGGTILQNAVSFRPSLNVGVPTPFALSGSAVPTFVAQTWNV